jgi:hypothetical protein
MAEVTRENCPRCHNRGGISQVSTDEFIEDEFIKGSVN